MSSNRVGTANWSSNGSKRISLLPSADVSVSRKRLLRAPKTPQEKVLCYLLSLSFVVTMVLVAALCIISGRWKATLSKLPNTYVKEDDVCDTEACFESAQRLLSSLDPSTDPCEDFYQYACGGWIEKNPIPKGRGVYMAYNLRTKEVADMVVDLLDKVGDNVTEPRALVSLGNFYRGCKDNDTRRRVGLEPLKRLLREMGGWPMVEGDAWDAGGTFSWYRRVAEMNRKLLLKIIVEIELHQDVEDSSSYKLLLARGRYIFPRYHGDLAENPKTNATDSVVSSIVETALLMGSSMDPERLREEAMKIVLFDYGLAQTGEREDEDDILETTVGELQENITEKLAKYPDFSYADLINLHLQSEVPVTEDTAIYLESNDHFAQLPGFIDKVHPRNVANYLAFYIVRTFASYTVEDLWSLLHEDGRDWSEPRACRRIARRFMSHALDRHYLDRNFTPHNRYHVTKMVEMIRLAYSSTLDQNGWMDKDTMLYSLVKLQSMDSMIGYQEWISDDQLLDKHYEKVLDIKEEDYFGAVLKMCILAGDEKYRRWNTTVQRNNTIRTSAITVNAFYLPRSNFMVLPAGILGYPFYKYNRIDSINYGGIGTVIGHEISHAFDAYGRLFDHEGNLRNWWTNETQEKFLDKVDCFAEQYENFVDDDHPLKVDGNSTLSENIADNGAIRNAFKAFRLHLALSDEYMNNRKVLPGLPATPEQLFFLGYASVWCANMTDDYARAFKDNDDHSPNKVRVNVPLSNFQEFAKAFKCNPGTPMNPRHKCVLW